MNSVFSAFKTGKSSSDNSSSSNSNNHNKSKSSGKGTNVVSNSVSINKKLSTQDPTSYENLRHIREITMSNNFIATGDEKTTIAVLPSVQSSSSLSEKSHVDVLGLDFNECTLEDTVDSSSSTSTLSSTGNSEECLTMPPPSIPYSAALPPSGKTTSSLLNHEPNSEPNLLACANTNNAATNASYNTAGSDSGSDSEHNFINKIKARSEQLIGGSSNSNSRFNNNKPRLSLSSASGVGFNNSMPSVHGRSTGTVSTNGTTSNANGAPTRTRLSTHQRNLSLDFR